MRKTYHFSKTAEVLRKKPPSRSVHKSKALKYAKIKSKNKSDNFFYLKMFIFSVVILFLISLAVKFLIEVEHSRFQDEYFNVLVVNKDEYILNVNKEKKSISIFEVKDNQNDISNSSREKLSIDLGLPIDAIFIYKNGEGFQDKKDLLSFQNLFSAIFSPSKYSITGLDKLDLIKLYFASKFMSFADTKVEVLLKDSDEEKILDSFKDKNVIDQGITIEVVNASGLSGAGTKVASMLKNVGFNVISVNSEDEGPSKIIVRTSKNYTIERLGSIFSIPLTFKNETGITDVSIVIGKDYALKNIDTN